MLGVSLRTVQLWVESGDLAAWKTVGGHRRITLPSVVQLLDEQLAALEKPKADSVYRILIIDPDPPSADHFAKSLAEADPRVMLDCAQDGYHGLMLAGRNIPRLLIVEPSRSGLDSLRLATALSFYPNPHRESSCWPRGTRSLHRTAAATTMGSLPSARTPPWKKSRPWSRQILIRLDLGQWPPKLRYSSMVSRRLSPHHIWSQC